MLIIDIISESLKCQFQVYFCAELTMKLKKNHEFNDIITKTFRPKFSIEMFFHFFTLI